MGGSIRTTLLFRFIVQLTYSNAMLVDGLKPCSFSTMLLLTRSELWMRSQHGRWSKVRILSIFFLHASLTTHPAPKRGWTHHPDGPPMHPSVLPNGTVQSFYFPDDHPATPGWFKGMEEIIRERGLWPKNGLRAQCPDFKCPPGRTDCCCRWLLFLQPDFISQKSQLEEEITSRGHLCDFYPKYHCELNFIEQYWGAAKLRFREAKRAATVKEMERVVITCLDAVLLLQIQR